MNTHTAHRFPAVLQAAHDAIIITDPEQTILFCNRSAEGLFGYRADELMGQKLARLLPLPLVEVHDRHFRRFASGHKTSLRMDEKREVSGRHKDGTIFPAEASIAKFEEGGETFFSVNLRDVTKAREAELERVRLLHDLGERVKELTVLHGAARLFQVERPLDEHFLAQFASLLPPGWQYPEVCEARISYKDLCATTPGWRDAPWKQSAAFETSEGTGVIEVVYLVEKPAAAEGPFLAEERALLNSLVDILEDHLEHRRAVADLRHREMEFRAIFENAGIGMGLVDLDGRMVTCNPQLEHFLGYSREELMALTFVDVTHPDDVQTDMQLFQSMIAGERESYSIEKRYTHKGGQILWGRLTVSLVHSGGGMPRYVVGMVEDVTARKQAEERSMRLYEEATRRLSNVQALRLIDIAIASNMELQMTLGIVLDQTLLQLAMDTGTILLLDPATSMLKFAAGRGFRGQGIEHTLLQLGEGLAGRSAQQQELIVVQDQTLPGFDSARAILLQSERLLFHAVAPLIVKGQVKGVIEVFKRKPFEPDSEWQDFFNTLAGQTSIALDNADMFTGLQQSNANLIAAYDETLAGWSRALDFRDKETEGHTQRVTSLALKLAGQMGVEEEELVNIRRGALLHDIGKVGVPDGILLKPGPLNSKEWNVMRRHPEIAREMLAPIRFLQKALDIPYCHHEKWDGTGYPRGLKGEQIPLSARIFAVADVWDALRSDRPYRQGWSEAQVVEYIQMLSGSHFDPHVVQAFLELIEKGFDE